MSLEYPTYSQLSSIYVQHMLSSYSNCEKDDNTSYIDYNDNTNVYANNFSSIIMSVSGTNRIVKMQAQTIIANIDENIYAANIQTYSKEYVEEKICNFISSEFEHNKITQTDISIQNFNALVTVLQIFAKCSIIYFRYIKSVLYNINNDANNKCTMPIIFYDAQLNNQISNEQHTSILQAYNQFITHADYINITNIIICLFNNIKILQRNYLITAYI